MMQKRVKRVSRGDTGKGGSRYLSALAGGMAVTLGHMLGNLSDIRSVETLEYPEEEPGDITSRYRGLHRLTHREDGTIRCVACFMCATACPAGCISIEAMERDDGIAEKMPAKFRIDLLECIFCGYCVEACPCDAIRMDTGIFSIIGREREDFIMDRDRLLSHRGAFGEEDSRG
jgi:NADH-quinone oxidoreductase subunit I